MLKLSQMKDEALYFINGEIVSRDWILRRIMSGTLFKTVELFEEDEKSISSALKSFQKTIRSGSNPEVIEIYGKSKTVKVDIVKEELHEGFECHSCRKKFSDKTYPNAEACPNCGESELLFETFVIEKISV